MHRLRMPDELGPVEHYKRQFDQFKEIAKEIICRLHSDYKSWEVDVSDVENNMFRFSYWGLEFIVKTEIAFDKELDIFNIGELNTYLKDPDSLRLVSSFKFDSLGNINNKYEPRNFTLSHYLTFVNGLLTLSSEGKIKFLL